MRRLIGLLAAAAAVLASPMLLPPECAFACSCGAPTGSPQEIIASDLAGSEAVFVGRVVDNGEVGVPFEMEGTVMEGVGTTTVTLQVSETWKGAARETVDVQTGRDSGGGCGFPFREGEEYLVYASEDMSVSLCSGTKSLSEASTDLEVLGEGEKPERAALPDTAGSGSGKPRLLPWALLGGAAAGLALVSSAWRTRRRR